MRAAVAAPTHQLPERAHAPPWPQRGGQHAASLTQKELSCATHVTRRCPLGSSPESDMPMASMALAIVFAVYIPPQAPAPQPLLLLSCAQHTWGGQGSDPQPAPERLQLTRSRGRAFVYCVV